GLAVTECIEPGGTPLGATLRELLLHHKHDLALPAEALLFMASRAQLTATVIRPALAAGHRVVSHRFLLATVVYQGYAGGLDPAALWQVGHFATGGLEPDLTVVLDLPVEQALARRGRPADRIESRDAAYQQRVRNGFLAEAQRRPDRVVVLDAADTVERIHERVTQEVERVLAARARA